MRYKVSSLRKALGEGLLLLDAIDQEWMGFVETSLATALAAAEEEPIKPSECSCSYR
jgi:hypothetical protein